MRKIQLTIFFPVFILLVVIFLFFANLFIPKLQTFVTPDFGQSDIFQLNVPLKFFLAENLKNNQLPLWNPYIANGFPALAEGQTGTFFILNLILFKFLPFPLAFNLGIVSIFLTTAIGTYLFCKELKMSMLACFFSALTFTFSGFFICHLTHFNLIQASSLFPLLLFLTLKMFKSVKTNKLFIWGGLFSLTLSQQLFTGFPQIVLITLIWVLLLYFYTAIFNRTIKSKTKLYLFLILLISIVLGFLISAIQLIPQYEFLKISTRSGLSDNQANYYSYPFKHLITLISPYFLGNPKLGTYPPFYKFDGSVFWENTGYIGLLGIALGLLGILMKSSSKKFLLISLIFSFLLMTGKYSPLYFIYEMPPLSLFRVPSRFILPFIFSLTILFGLTLQYVFQKVKLRFLLVVIIAIQLVDLWNFGLNYHSIGKWEDWLSKPQTAEFITAQTHEKINNSRVISLDTHQIWNEIFTTKGWSNPEPYFYFRNDLLANYNILYNIRQFGVYPVQKTKRYDYFESLLLFGVNNNEKQISINTTSTKLLATAGVNYLITPKNINTPENNQPVYKTTPGQNLPSYNIYSLKPSYSAYFTSSFLSASTLEEVLDLLSSKKFNPPQNVILEKEFKIDEENKNSLPPLISLIKSTNTENIYEVVSNKDGFFVLSQSFYPGWKVFVDGTQKEVLPANLNFTAVYLTAGNHQVSFIYKPTSWKIGRFLSLAGIVITFLMVFAAPLIFSRKAVNTHSFSSHR